MHDLPHSFDQLFICWTGQDVVWYVCKQEMAGNGFFKVYLKYGLALAEVGRHVSDAIRTFFHAAALLLPQHDLDLSSVSFLDFPKLLQVPRKPSQLWRMITMASRNVSTRPFAPSRLSAKSSERIIPHALVCVPLDTQIYDP